MLLLLLLDVAIAGTIGMIYLRSRAIELRDPVAGYHAPVPGVAEGGYGPIDAPQAKTDAAKTAEDSTAKTSGE